MVSKKKEEVKILDTLVLPDGPETVDKKYVPEGFETVEKYLEDMRETFELDLTSDYDNRLEALEDKKFAAGEQWDPEVLKHRTGLPCLKINTVPQFTAQLVGDWRSNRNAIKVLPSEDGDVDVASVRGDLIRAIEVKSRATRVYDSAFESMVQCGDGAMRVCVEYAREDVFDQDIFIRPIEDALSVVWDRMSVDATGRDAIHCYVNDTLPRKEFDRRWPQQPLTELSDQLQTSLRISGWSDQDTVRVTEHWRLIERPKLLAMFQDGVVKELSAETLDEVVAKHGPPVKTRVAPCTYAQMHLVTGHAILAGPYEYKINRLPIIRMSGRVINIDGRRIRHGLIRDMKDPVRMRNFWRSVMAEQLGYAPKAQWLASDDAVEGREDDFRNAHLTRDPLLIYNSDAENAPQRVDPPIPPVAIFQQSEMNTQDLKDVTGIHDASLGIKSNETSGRAIMARQREGDIANLTYHDNGNAALLEAGDVINQLIPQIYDGTRILRVIGEDQEPKFVKINDPYNPKSIDLSIGNYDVVLSTGTSYMTRRVEAAQAMMEAVQVYPEMMQIAGDLVAKAQDWPGAQELSERLKKTIPPQFLDEEDREGMPEQQPQMDPEMIQQAMMKMEELQTENELLKAEHEIKMRDLEIKQFDAETKRLQVLAQSKTDMDELDLREMEMEKSSEQFEKEQKTRKTEAKSNKDKAKSKPSK